MTDDAVVRHQAFDIGLGEGGDPLEIDPCEGGADILPLGKDGAPA